MSQTDSNCSCPLCERQDGEKRIYQHLQRGHRKSELSRRLLEETHGSSQELIGAEMEASASHPSLNDSVDQDDL
jgi:hypothetical protein